MGQALYRKYRSKKLSELVGQEHITKTLSNALKSGQISHAYLFTGPRGVGKTSVARILAHEVNNIPYDDDSNHLDIIEIDAASNRRIDEIRELRERVNLAPTSAKYKVYIIDEVHMLTKEAFNALLKTLEEPPAHVIFILATTEANKVPETISSRTQQFKFKPIPVAEVIAELAKIAKSENISIDDESLHLISEFGEGSFRDSIGLLDQASSLGDKVTITDLESLLGMAPNQVIDNLIKDIEESSLDDLMSQLSLIDEAGYNIALLCKQLIKKLQTRLINHSTSINNTELIALIRELIEVPISSDPTSSLQLALLSVALADQPHKSAPTTSVPVPEPKIEKPEETPVKVPNDIETNLKTETPKRQATGSTGLNLASWNQVLRSIKSTHNTLYGIAKTAVPEFQDNKLILKCKYPFHERRLSETKNIGLIKNLILELTGQQIEIECVVDKNIVTEPEKAPSQIQTISNIFGNAEMVE